jgi:non-specific serine/threonine protein kinase/serine/threonine-protein kinase
MKPADWDRLKLLFEQALAVPPEDRDRFLGAQTADPAMLTELRSLLEVHEGSPEFLEGAVPDIGVSDIQPLEGRRIGPWRLTREIGRGGMGVVWEAVRSDEEYRQRAAIKLLPIGTISGTEIARFREERQILAGLNHPGIARLLDGGTAADGSPYLAMEYVEGERLDEWYKHQSPTLRDRLQLFLSICAAVDYAHRHLVIHRDLKPANILVTPEGAAKLLDFGIAKLLDSDGAARRAVTGTSRPFTPGYASPEQVCGDLVTTGSDIYSLGVTLYFLLSGRSPYSALPDDSFGLMQEICMRDPPPPSALAERGAHVLRGDLDAIVLQTLRKNPESRYPSVRALADDITAWLEGRPVTAHTQPWWRRSGQYIRRHKTQSVAVATVLLSIFAGSAVAVWYARDAARQRRVAEIRFNQGRQLAHSVVFDLQDAIARLPGSTRARAILVERALQYLRNLEASGPANRDLEIELAAAYSRIGDVQGDPNRAHLGDTKGAIESQRRARQLALDVLRSHPGDMEAETILVDADERLVVLANWQGQPGQRNALWLEGIGIRRKHAALHPGDAELAVEVQRMEASELLWQRKWSEALLAYQHLAAIDSDTLARQPQNSDLGNRLSSNYHRAAHCWKELNRWDNALACYRKAAQMDEVRLSVLPGDTEVQTSLSFDLVEAGWVEYRLNRFHEAIADYERALAIQERLAAADPDDILMRLEAAKLLNTAAPAYEAAGERAKAARILTTSGDRLEAALASDPENEDTRFHVAWVWCNLGALEQRAAAAAGSDRQRVRTNLESAEAHYRRAREVLASLKGAGRPDLDMDPQPILARVDMGLVDCRKQLAAGPGR